MKINGSVALVTGANRGLGRALAAALLERGATVYATARNPDSIDLPGATALPLDVTDQASVDAVVARATDVDLLINNAGVSTYQNLVSGDLDKIHLEMDTHFFGTLRMVRAFAPVLAGNGGGAIVNMLSALSWLSFDGADAYCAAKAAEWSLTNGIRLELAGQQTMVTAVHLGAADTDMMAGYQGPMTAPADVAWTVLAGIEDGRIEVLVDDDTRQLKANLSGDPGVLYPSAVSR